MAKITARGTSGGLYVYSWTEQVELLTGLGYTDHENPRTGTSTNGRAYERNNAAVPVNTVVELRLRQLDSSGYPVYDFDAPDGTATTGTVALTVAEVDGSPSYTLTSTITVEQADGLQLSQPGAKQVRIDILAATNAQAGIVSTAAQSLAGIKTFIDGLVCDQTTRTVNLRVESGGIGTYPRAALASLDAGADESAVIELYQSSGSATLTLSLIDEGGTDSVLSFDSVGGNPARIQLRDSLVHDGATGTDALGNSFYGGICVAVGGGSGSYTDEEAQDAVGTILADTDTVNATYTDGTPEIKFDVRYQMSVTADASGLKLSGDSASPGNSYYYGTDSGGTKGYHALTSGSPRNYIDGLALSFVTSTTVQVGAGKARDNANAADITLASAVTVDITAAGALGVDSKTLSGTGAVAATATITGTGAAFLTEFGTRTCSGTITGAGTTITGTSTKFLTEFSVDDLIGTAAVGYSRITAIASDTSLTIVAAMPGGSAGGTTPICIENATVTMGSQDSRRINTIASNTSLVAESAYTGTTSGNTLKAGEPNSISGTQAFYLWLASGGSGTTVYLSSQRTTPFGVSGYTTSLRRIGSLTYYDATTHIVPFRAERQGNTVQYLLVAAADAYGNRVVSSGGTASWARISARPLVPSTADQLVLGAFLTNPAGAVSVNLRCASVDSYATLTSPHRVNAEAGGRSGAQFHVGCDGAQCFDWTLNTADANNPATVEIGGYSEVLP